MSGKNDDSLTLFSEFERKTMCLKRFFSILIRPLFAGKQKCDEHDKASYDACTPAGKGEYSEPFEVGKQFHEWRGDPTHKEPERRWGNGQPQHLS